MTAQRPPVADEHRVQFDFEIDFSNGGGIQGQGFRLDIDGDAISDQELATWIVGDLRLLMVGDVRILNKQIIREPHKRSRITPEGGHGDRRVRIDLSHVVDDGMVTYPGIPAPVICDFLSREQSRAHYSAGTEFQIGTIELCGNTGTYLDSPFHRYSGRTDLASLPLDRLAELDALVVDISGQTARAVDRNQFLPYDVHGKAVLIRTGWDRHWRTDAYFHGHPFLTAAAAEHLAAEGAVLAGIDSMNIDDTSGGERPAHSALLVAGIPICEHLTNLAALPIDGFRFSAVPVKVRGMGTFPVRAYATIYAVDPGWRARTGKRASTPAPAIYGTSGSPGRLPDVAPDPALAPATASGNAPITSFRGVVDGQPGTRMSGQNGGSPCLKLKRRSPWVTEWANGSPERRMRTVSADQR